MTTAAAPGNRSPWRTLLARMNAAEARLALREGLSWRWLVTVFFAAFVLLALRSPDRLLAARFYAEDGAVWYQDAYNLGWLHSLTLQDGGYLNSLQRLGILPALLLPLQYAPLAANLVGLLIQCLPVVILLSPRCRRWAPLTTRALFAGLYVLIPNAREIHIVLTNAQWHLALVMPLLAFAEAPRTRAGRVFDIVTFLVGGFSGPFCIVLLPFTLVFWWFRRQRWTLLQAGTMFVGAAVQISLIVTHPAARAFGKLGASHQLFFRMLGGNIFAAAMFGGAPFGAIAPYPLILFAVAGGVSLLLYTLRAAPLELKLFILFCFTLLPPALHSPLITGPKPLWHMLVDVHSSRYWFFPMMAYVWSAAWCSQFARVRFFRYAGVAVLVAMPIGIAEDFHYNAFPELQFLPAVARFQAAAPGQHVVIDVVPKGTRMTLIKKQ